jgi:hypothetical protein
MAMVPIGLFWKPANAANWSVVWETPQTVQQYRSNVKHRDKMHENCYPEEHKTQTVHCRSLGEERNRPHKRSENGKDVESLTPV